MIDVVSRRRSNPSPLRYPGGKASLADFFEETIKELGLDRPTYVEPFAGGAGAGLELLYRGVVRKVVINDYDRSIYSIWKSMLSADDVARFLEDPQDAPQLVVVNPPRTGLERSAARLAAVRAPRVIYVSCNPPTLARDLAAFRAQGYAAGRIRPIDLFPQTCRVETVCELVLT